jgi:hypothetical protein
LPLCRSYLSRWRPYLSSFPTYLCPAAPSAPPPPQTVCFQPPTAISSVKSIPIFEVFGFSFFKTKSVNFRKLYHLTRLSTVLLWCFPAFRNPLSTRGLHVLALRHPICRCYYYVLSCFVLFSLCYCFQFSLNQLACRLFVFVGDPISVVLFILGLSSFFGN